MSRTEQLVSHVGALMLGVPLARRIPTAVALGRALPPPGVRRVKRFGQGSKTRPATDRRSRSPRYSQVTALAALRRSRFHLRAAHVSYVCRHTHQQAHGRAARPSLEKLCRRRVASSHVRCICMYGVAWAYLYIPRLRTELQSSVPCSSLVICTRMYVGTRRSGA